MSQKQKAILKRFKRLFVMVVYYIIPTKKSLKRYLNSQIFNLISLCKATHFINDIKKSKKSNYFLLY